MGDDDQVGRDANDLRPLNPVFRLNAEGTCRLKQTARLEPASVTGGRMPGPPARDFGWVGRDSGLCGWSSGVMYGLVMGAGQSLGHGYSRV